MEKKKNNKLVRVRLGLEKRFIEIGETLEQFKDNFINEFKLTGNNSIDYVLSCKDKANRITKVDKESIYQEIKNYLINFPNLIEPYFIQKQNSIHKNSKCVECGISPIIGIKYQCMNCPSYELCSDCENKIRDNHGHPLLKLRKAEYFEKFRNIIFQTNDHNHSLANNIK